MDGKGVWNSFFAMNTSSGAFGGHNYLEVIFYFQYPSSNLFSLDRAPSHGPLYIFLGLVTMHLIYSVPISVRMLHTSGKAKPTKTGTNNKGNALAHISGWNRSRTGLRIDQTLVKKFYQRPNFFYSLFPDSHTMAKYLQHFLCSHMPCIFLHCWVNLNHITIHDQILWPSNVMLRPVT